MVILRHVFFFLGGKISGKILGCTFCLETFILFEPLLLQKLQDSIHCSNKRFCFENMFFRRSGSQAFNISLKRSKVPQVFSWRVLNICI